jgi:hypothetical protein
MIDDDSVVSERGQMKRSNLERVVQEVTCHGAPFKEERHRRLTTL